MSEKKFLKTAMKMMGVMKVFGYAPFSVVNKKSVTKTFDVLHFLVCITIGLIHLYASIKFRHKFTKSNSSIADVGNLVSHVASVVITLVSMIQAFQYRHKTWQMILRMFVIDNQLREINFFKDYSIGAKVLLGTVFLIMTMSIPLQITIYYIDGSLLKATIFFYSGLYLILNFGLVVGNLNGTLLRLEAINSALSSILSNPSKFRIVVLSKNNKQHDTELLRRLIEIYTQLMETFRYVSLCFGIRTMLGFGLLFFYGIFTFFMMFKDFSNFGTLNRVTLAPLLSSSYISLFALAVIVISSLLKRAAGKTLQLSNAILKRSKDETEVAMLISFNDYIMRNSPKFTCGFFDFDCNLLYGVSY